LPLLQSFALNQLIPSIFDAAASLLLVFIVLRIFRIDNPRTKFALYYIILVRAFIVLIDNASARIHVSPERIASAKLLFGVRFLDPFNLISQKDFGYARSAIRFAYSSDTFAIVVLFAFCAIACFMLIRWVQLLSFLLRLKNEPELDSSKYGWINDLVDNLSDNLHIKRPRIVQSKNFPTVPFTVGFKSPTIVLSEDLMRKFSREQIEIMIAHEISHLKRGDYINNWFLMIVRDLMFFNPFTYLIYRKAEEEKEKICDREILNLVNTTPNKIASLLVDVALFYKAELIRSSNISPSLTKGFLYNKTMLDRRIASIMRPAKPSSLKAPLKYINLVAKIAVFAILLFFQVSCIFVAGNQLLILR
jgi:beta-lactamase regulating signal transducer with metallopeptidase domain